ncbi:glycerol-3-phosphate 1-O-acyltransferase PlsY [Mycoplasma sp. Ms02]|uniref:glycerol-3-phosphate 1-O-acyltransferase PlsY n=1 Tax=Mycoplasma sp. Ms02 TaxID=353851 RepID=UPI001C8A6EC9|nr:glycerol-3-phosphate 1-O-acyltransferase PlsY [Mycoplasma sp. Ms02]QZE12568.1 glycerol-3-phosphate 1-O-acyltransferase PlsY [Mycoplasma sp. Ms02]
MQIWFTILSSVIFLVFGYIIGSLNTSILYGKIFKKGDVREHFSKNAGATNTNRVYGKKVALTVLFVDILKTIFAVYIAFLLCWIFKTFYFDKNQDVLLFPLLAGLGVVIGHTFPVFFKFQGGKGVASCIGLLFCFNPILLVAGAAIYIFIVWRSRYVSLASILSGLIMIALGYLPWIYDLWPLHHILNGVFWIDATIFSAGVLLMIALHHSNIKRLLNKSENKLKFKN